MFAYCLNSPVSRVDMSGNISEDAAKEKIKEQRDEILAAAEEFDVDPVAIACCIYAEQVLNYDWKDVITDYLCYFLDTSIGFGQVKVSTAKFLEDAGYMPATEAYFNPDCPDLYISRNLNIAAKLLDDTENIRYVAAYLAYWQDTWSSVIDISQRTDILATLYNLGTNAKSPNHNPSPNAFGEFAAAQYALMEELLYD
jgi:hypothetical protein